MTANPNIGCVKWTLVFLLHTVSGFSQKINLLYHLKIKVTVHIIPGFCLLLDRKDMKKIEHVY